MSRYGSAATPDRPEFEVKVGGTAVAPLVARDVVEVDVAEEVGRHGRLTLLVQNWDPDARAVRHSDDGPFAPGAGIEVLLGYHSDLVSVFEGVVTSITAHFPATTAPVLRVEARSRSILLDGPPRSRVLEEASDADVASTLASEHGLTADAEEGATRPFVVSDRRTDWDLLRERAERLGWALYVRGTSLVLRPPAEAQEPIELEHGLNLTELHLTQDLTRVAESSTVTLWDAESLEAVSSEAGPGQSGIDAGDRPDHAAALGDADWTGRADVATGSALGATADADLLAAGRQRRAALAHVSGSGSVVGNPALRCDSWVSIAGVGSRLAGPHYVTATRHRLSASRGYVTEFQVGLPAPLLPPPTPARPGGGLVIGVVEDLADPQGWGRVKVGLPWRTDAADAVWARLATVDAGPGQGSVFLPDVGQEVLVGRIDGDDAQPVVLGALWNGTQAPPDVLDTDGNDVRGIVTRSGHRLLFDDGDPATLTLETAAGSSLVISDSDGQVVLTDSGSGSAITISSDGIELSAAQGDITLKAAGGKVVLEGTGIEGTSSGPAKLESAATLDITASATLGLTGALVTIN